MARDTHTDHKRHRQERRIDDAVEDSFPASDPPSHSSVTGVARHDPHQVHGARSPSHARGDDARPSGQPTDERYATETAHHREDGRKR
jgi:hypothetical protein